MKISELFKIIKFLRKTRGCVILKDDLGLKTFGTQTNILTQYRDLIFNITFRNSCNKRKIV